MKSAATIIVLLFILSIQSCHLRFETVYYPTVVNGTVTNSITGEIIEDLPIKLYNEYGFDMTVSDFSKTVYTDANGQFTYTIPDKIKGSYYAGLGEDYNYYSDETPLKSGQTNTINIVVVPYKTLQVHIQKSKESKNALYLQFQTSDSEGSYLIDFYDNISKTQHDIDTILFFRVFPLRNYRFDMQLCNRSYDEYQNPINDNCSLTTTFFYFNNVDTAKVEIH